MTFHANCVLRRQFARNVIVYFLGKTKKNISKCHLLTFLPSMLNVKYGKESMVSEYLQKLQYLPCLFPPAAFSFLLLFFFFLLLFSLILQFFSFLPPVVSLGFPGRVSAVLASLPVFSVFLRLSSVGLVLSFLPSLYLSPFSQDLQNKLYHVREFP